MFRIIPAFIAVSVLRCVRLERNVLGSAALSKWRLCVWRLILLNWGSRMCCNDQIHMICTVTDANVCEIHRLMDPR